MPGLYFVDAQPPRPVASSRADIAVFIGLTTRTVTPISSDVNASLHQQGWLPIPTRVGEDDEDRAAMEAGLLGLPIAVESWDQFITLYGPGDRATETGSSDRLPCPMALAVRSFFNQGGQRAYIVRTGDPVALANADEDADEFAKAKRALLDWHHSADAANVSVRQPILPGFTEAKHQVDPGDRATWRGLGVLFGIEDAAMVLLPDLIELAAGMPLPAAPVADPPGPPEIFKDCAVVLPAAIPDDRPARPEWRAARLSPQGYVIWADGLRFALDVLGRPRGPAHRRDVMLLGSCPLPLTGTGMDDSAERDPISVLGVSDAVLAGQTLLSEDRIGNARLQLAYPWIATQASAAMPEAVEQPEGAFAGMLAQSALRSGAFRSAVGQPLRDVRFTLPDLGNHDIALSHPGISDWTGARISLFGRRYGTMTLLSDVTTTQARAWQPGGISRLMGIILRGARHMGDEVMFEPSGPTVWNNLRGQMERFLEGLRQNGALSGATPAEAYTVICGRQSMTQGDLDAGRAIATISFSPAFPVERITVSLALLEPVASPIREAA